MAGKTPNKKLIFALPKKTAGVSWGESRGGLYLPVIPGTDTVLHLAIIRLILENGWEDKDFIARKISNKWEIGSGMGRGTRNTPWQWVTTWGKYGTDFAGYKKWVMNNKYAELERAAKITGVSAKLIRQAAEMIAKPKADGKRPKSSFMLEKA